MKKLVVLAIASALCMGAIGCTADPADPASEIANIEENAVSERDTETIQNELRAYQAQFSTQDVDDAISIVGELVNNFGNLTDDEAQSMYDQMLTYLEAITLIDYVPQEAYAYDDAMRSWVQDVESAGFNAYFANLNFNAGLIEDASTNLEDATTAISKLTEDSARANAELQKLYQEYFVD